MPNIMQSTNKNNMIPTKNAPLYRNTDNANCNFKRKYQISDEQYKKVMLSDLLYQKENQIKK